LGAPTGTKLLPRQNPASYPFNVFGTFTQGTGVNEVQWAIFDVVPTLMSDYYLRVEQIHLLFSVYRSDPNPAVGIEMDPCLEYSTSMTSTELAPSHDKFPLQHVLSLDGFMKYPVDTYMTTKIRSQVEPDPPGTAFFGLEMAAYTKTSFDLTWNNGIQELPNVDIIFTDKDGVKRTWVDAAPSGRGNYVTISGFSGYPVSIMLQETVGAKRSSETLKLYEDGQEQRGFTQIKAVYKAKELFIPEAPLMVDRVRDTMFMRQFGMKIEYPVLFIQNKAVNVDVEITRVRLALYPVGARYDMGSRR
jgi:hypothetical protein